MPTIGAVRETLDFLSENIPNWNKETSSEEFAKILVKRYPELKLEWTDTRDDEGDGDLDGESATEKQIAYLKVLGAPVPNCLGIREASDLIEKWKNRASDAQKRRLNFYGLDYDPDIAREQATVLIDCYKERHPESEDAYQEWKAQKPHRLRQQRSTITSQLLAQNAAVFFDCDALNRDRRLDGWMRVVTDQLEIFEFEIVDVFHGGIELHARQGSTITV